MHRGFETSTTRRQQTLDGRWEFVTDPDDTGRQQGYHESFPEEDADELPVPCSWNAHAEYADYIGPAWYRTTFRTAESGATSLTFHGIGHEGRIYLDGREIATHSGGYTPVSTVIPDLDSGTHELVVRADNTLDETTIPQPDADWFPHGGLYREVVVEEVSELFIDDFAIEYELIDGGADVELSARVRNLADEFAERELAARIGETETRTHVTVPAGGDEIVELSLTLDGVDRWSLDEPTLYDVSVRFPGDDDLRDRIGFREIDVDGREIRLNGDPVTVVGVNRHEDHPDWGHAQPVNVQQRDLDILERANINTIRCSHYPNHPRFLDLCDEAGILVIEEIPYWQFDSDDFEREGVLEKGKRMLSEMIERDRHHPSVFAWSLHNECYNHEDGMYEATAELKETVLSHDDSRLVTLATNTDWRGYEDPLVELCDFVCVNGYWGWYRDDRDWETFLDQLEDRYESKPIVISEFGAGAVEGERTFEGRKWSETYQAELLDEVVSLFLERDSVAGFTVWQYCDTLSMPSKAMTRPRAKNNKGIVTEYRRPKDGYWAIKRTLDER